MASCNGTCQIATERQHTGETETETELEKDRQTDRQTDSKEESPKPEPRPYVIRTDRQKRKTDIDRHTDRQTE